MDAVQIMQPSMTSEMKSFADKFMQDLCAILDENLWSDIEVKVQGKSFHCHKIILAARSCYFKEKLKSDRYLTEYVEYDGDSESFELVRQYICTGSIDFDEADEGLIANVLSLSAKYKLDELTNFVSQQLKKRITTANAVKVFNLMADIKLHSIAEECMKLIQTSGNDCLRTECYIDLSLNHVVRLLKQASLSGDTKLTLIREWSKKHRNVNTTKLFVMLDGEYKDDNDVNDENREKQYILISDYNGKMVMLDAQTFDEVLTRHEPTLASSQLAVCNGLLYVIDTGKGIIKSTPLSSLWKIQCIPWDKCANFQSSSSTRGNVAVVGRIIYFVDKRHLWKFDTRSRAVMYSHDFRNDIGFYSLIEANDLMYAYVLYEGRYTSSEFGLTDGINVWERIVPATVHYNNCSLIKMENSVCLVGGTDQSYEVVSSVSCYDTTSKSWTLGKSINEARSKAATVSLDGGRTLVIGGSGCGTIELFDQATKEWNLIDYKPELYIYNPQAVTFYMRVA